MKRRDFLKNLKGKTIVDLTKMVQEKGDKIRSLRFDLTMGKVKNASEMKSLRRQQAVIKTKIREIESNKQS